MSPTDTSPGLFAFDAIDEIESKSEANDLLAAVGKAFSAFGYTSFLVVDAPETALQAQPRLLLNGWPNEWARTYFSDNLYECDPIAAHMRRSVYPFEWLDVQIDPRKDRRAAEVMEAARQHHLRYGYVIPVLRDQPTASCVTMAGEEVDNSPNAKRALYLISLYAHAKAVDCMGPEPEQAHDSLTNAERETLVWTAVGKSAWEISIILNISEPAVVWRLKQAQRKLHAVNKVQAVVNAMRSRQICL